MIFEDDIYVYRSPHDKNDYQVLKLENELEILMISDKKSHSSGASLVVNVGSFQETDVLGLAHFLEHMLFMGNKKYPKANYYFNYINSHGGYSNAFTANRHTCYFFEIDSTYFIKALDIFSHFFIDPLLDEEYVSKEINAVQSEYDKNINIDITRIRYLLKHITNENHPYHKFDIGSKETLGVPNICEKLKQFFHQYYSANIMKLIILDNKPISEMKKYVLPIFNQIKNNSIKMNHVYGDPFSGTQLIQMNNQENQHFMSLMWTLPYLYQFKMQRPICFLNYVIGRESYGSLSALLKEKNWIKKLEVRIFENLGDYLIYQIDIQLTHQGLKYVDDIYCFVLQYIETLLNNQASKKIYNYLRYAKFFNFLYPLKLSTKDFLIKMTHHMTEYGASLHEVVTYDNLICPYINTFDQLINHYISLLTVSRLQIIINSSKYNNQTNYTEKWIGVKYNIYNDIPQKYTNFNINNITSGSILSKEFIPKSLSFYQDFKSESPKRLNENLPIWGNSSIEYGPKLCILAELYFPQIYTSIETYVIYGLIINIINKKLEYILYDALVVGYYFSFDISHDTITFELYGFDDKIDIMLNKIIDVITHFNFDEDSFLKARNSLMVDLTKLLNLQPVDQLSDWIDESISKKSFKVVDQIKILLDLKYSSHKFESYSHKLKGNMKCLVNGNLSLEKYHIICDHLNQLYDTSVSPSIVNWELHEIVKGTYTIYEKNLPQKINSLCGVQICIKYIDMKNIDDQRIYCLNMLINIIFTEPFFHQLRTIQQLGYVVKTNILFYGHISYPLITQLYYIQTAAYHPHYLEKQIMEFIERSVDIINFIDEKKLMEYKNACQFRLQNNIFDLPDQTNELFIPITSNHYMFNYTEILMNMTKTITLKDLKEFHHLYFTNDQTRIIKVFKIYGNLLNS